jgi:Tol biopolymer transport system component
MQLTSGSVVDDGTMGLSWTFDGRIVYSSQEPSGDYQLWMINTDGTSKRRITTGKQSKFYPGMTRDGRWIVYMSDQLEVWRSDVDGGNPKLLSGIKKVRYPRFSPDSKWILYSTFASEKQYLIKVDLDGGKEVTLASHKYILGIAISPDGSQIAYVYMDPDQSHDPMINIIPFEGGAASKSFRIEKDVFPYGRIHWTPDGNGIAYIRDEHGVSNIYIQPIDGSPPRRFSNFTSDRILHFAWSLDGKQIAYSRAKIISDIVLIQNVP